MERRCVLAFTSVPGMTPPLELMTASSSGEETTRGGESLGVARPGPL
jgi:hypothetical protein